MRVVLKLAAFAAVLATAFALAWGVGSAIDPIGTSAGTGSPGHVHGSDPAPDLDGLAIAADGVRLVPESTVLSVGTAAPFRFRVERTDDGTVVDAYDVTHERELHLVVVDQSLETFQHVHPVRGADGTWSVDLAVPAPGAYRVYADFRLPGNERSTVLSTTASAPGTAPAAVTHHDERDASAPGGYEFHVDGDVHAGSTSEVTVTVTRDGEPVDDLDPYLGAAGHLVALRAGDLAYAHVHAGDDAGSLGPSIRFAIDVPSPGTYRLFLDVSHEGVVRTAAFTVEVPPAGGASTTTSGSMEGHG